MATVRPPIVDKRSDIVSFGIVFVHIAFVLAPVFLAASTPLSTAHILFWLWFGVSAHGLTNLMHEAAHRLVFRHRKASDILGRWILGPLFIANFDIYRDRHWAHHNRFGENDDTKDVYLVSIAGWRVFRFALACLFFHAAIHRFFSQFSAPSGNKSQIRGAAPLIARTAVAHMILVAILILIGCSSSSWNIEQGLTRSAIAYCIVYVYGLGSLTVFVAALRAIAEHQQGGTAGVNEGRAALRNLKCNPVTRLVFGAYGFAEHAVHHHWPGIPSYRLTEALAILADAEPRLVPQHGYIAVLSSFWLGRAGR